MDSKWYYVSYRRKDDATKFEGYYTEERMRELVNDPNLFIEALTGSFDYEYAHARGIERGLNLTS